MRGRRIAPFKMVVPCLLALWFRFQRRSIEALPAQRRTHHRCRVYASGIHPLQYRFLQRYRLPVSAYIEPATPTPPATINAPVVVLVAEVVLLKYWLPN